MQESATLSKQPTFELELNERRYPLTETTKASKPRWLPAELPTSENPDDEDGITSRSRTAAQAIFTSLWNSLPIAKRTAEEFGAPKEVVRCIADSHGTLLQASRDLRQMFEAMCWLKLRSQRHPELDQQMQSEREAQYIDECLDHDFPQPMMSPAFRAENVVGEPSAIFDRFRTELLVATRTFVESLFSVLEKLVSDELVGLIKWTGDDTCHFYSFRSRVTHEVQSVDKRTIRSTREIRDHGRDLPFPYAKLIQEKKKEVTTKHGRHVFERIRHDQHLIDAVIHELQDPDAVVPFDIVIQFLMTIPDWLHPALRLVTGDCFRELLIRRQYRVEESREEIVTESVNYHFCPAIVLGDFVLVAWGDREHAAEIERRKEVDDRKRAKGIALRMGSVSVLVHYVGIIVVFVGQLRYEQLLRPGQVILLLGFVASNLAFRNRLKSIARRGTFRLYLWSNLARTTFLLAFLSLALSAPSRPVIGVCLFSCFLVSSLFLSYKCERLLGRNPLAELLRRPKQ